MFWSLLQPLLCRSCRRLNCARVTAAAVLLAAAPAMAQTVTLRATWNNMYWADVTLNDQLTARALIDTGATYLSLCGAAAKTLGLKLGRSVVLQTANGDITSRLSMVGSVRIGTIELRDVIAVVDADDGRCHDKIIVGMSVLKHLHVTLKGNSMILVARHGRPASLPAWSPPWSVILAGLLAALLVSLISVRPPGSGLHLRTGRYPNSRRERIP